MTDTFDRFTSPERGLFGDNEQADKPSSLHDDRVELMLFQHRESASGLALLLSPNSALSHAQWIPKSLVEEPPTTELVHPPGGDRCQYGLFKIARFKARQLGWERTANDGQVRLL